jgi:transcriptional regulator with XRE-family HTH domain
MIQTEKREQDMLFADWSEDRQTATPKPLADWIAAYPDHAAELVRWAVEAPVIDCVEQTPADPAADARVLAIGRQVIAEMRAQQRAAAPARLESLLQAAKQHGLTLKTLAERIGVGPSTVAKLQQRHFRPASLPAELIRRVADALQVTADQVRDYLRQPPTLSASASYKSADVPRTTTQEDFAQAIHNCLDMTEEQKSFWLTALPETES